jgi:N-acetyl-gamma-glutamyl-phosphate reductase
VAGQRHGFGLRQQFAKRGRFGVTANNVGPLSIIGLVEMSGAWSCIYVYSHAVSEQLSVGIVGASGFTGAELLRLLVNHPNMDVRAVTGDTQAGNKVAALYPSLAPAYGDMTYVRYEDAGLDKLDLVFACLPHRASQEIVGGLIDHVAHVIDLSADFRLNDPMVYETWYEVAHVVPELIDRFAYGLPELFRDEIKAKKHVAVPGCYPQAAVLPLAPLLQAGLIAETGIIIDAASGVSGAGRAAKANTTFCAVDEDFSAYAVGTHRHTPEIEQTLGTQVVFTPHLAPMNRGILATCYAKPTGATSADELLSVLSDFYADEPFVHVSDRLPTTKATLGSNTAHISARYDERTQTAMVFCALDNLCKGSSGGAIQSANIVAGLDETAGLPLVGLMP